MALTDMKLTPKEQKEATSMDYEKPTYPWGLCLSIDDETMQKLGIDAPAIGSDVMIVAKAKVTSISARADDDDKSNTSMSLQITAMEVSSATTSANAASALYGDK